MRPMLAALAVGGGFAALFVLALAVTVPAIVLAFALLRENAWMYFAGIAVVCLVCSWTWAIVDWLRARQHDVAGRERR